MINRIRDDRLGDIDGSVTRFNHGPSRSSISRGNQGLVQATMAPGISPSTARTRDSLHRPATLAHVPSSPAQWYPGRATREDRRSGPPFAREHERDRP